MDGVFPQDGFRAAAGGSPDAVEQGWQRGAAEWYHSAETPVELQRAWRALRQPFVTLLYSMLVQSVGDVLLAFQTALLKMPGLQEVRLQPDVPYMSMQSSSNAVVSCHLDDDDLRGTTITWLSFPAPGAAAAADAAPQSLGAAFVLYTCGVKFRVGHMSHCWVRSDKTWHGTVRNHIHDALQGGLLFGLALATSRQAVRQVLKVFRERACKTWLQQYSNEGGPKVRIVD